VLVLKSPPEILFKGLKMKIGAPRELHVNMKEGFPSNVNVDVPREILRQNGEEDGLSDATGIDEDSRGANRQAQPNQNAPLSDMHLYTPIKALSTFTYDWKIKARVIKKFEKRYWKKAKSEGHLMNVELMDSYGTQI